jgi:hypothetical protein
MLKFDEELTLNQGPFAHGEAVLDATGPIDQSEEEMVELCAWVFHRGDHDAAATEMTTGSDHHTAGGGHVDIVPGSDGRSHWKMALRQVGNAPLEPGEAFGVAVAMMRVRNQGNHQRVVWWGHPLRIVQSAPD